MAEGLRVRLSGGEVEADGRVTFSIDEHVWVAVIDWNAIRDVVAA